MWNHPINPQSEIQTPKWAGYQPSTIPLPDRQLFAV
jgi:hypothetical protein